MDRKVFSTLYKIKVRESGAQIAEENMCASYYKRRRDFRNLHSVSRPSGPVNYYDTVILADPAHIKQGTISPCTDRGTNMMCFIYDEHDKSPFGHWEKEGLGEGGGRKEECGEEISR